MTADGGRRTGGAALLLLKVAAAALGGGLLAAGVLYVLVRPPRTGPVLFVVVVVTVLAVLAVGTLRSALLDRDEAAVPVPVPARSSYPQAYPPPDPSTVPPPYPGRPSPHQSYVPPDQAPAGAPRASAPAWYDDGYDPRPVGPAAASVAPAVSPVPAVPEPDLRPGEHDEYDVPGVRRSRPRPVRRVVQCPRCGSFDVDLHPEGRSVAFACRACPHTWTWAAGMPWPTTIVRPTAATDRAGRDAGA